VLRTGAITRTGLLLLPLALLAGACHDHPDAAPIAPPVTPPSLQAPADQKPVLALTGSGHQIYTCSPAAEGVFAWVLTAPEAELFEPNTKALGKHYAGPTWESIDGSKVVGQVKAKADAPDPEAIPWLLLEAKSNEGSGVFSRVKSIQRVDTSSGKAPKTGCDAAHAGAQERVGYRAMYYFYVAR
jgi:hypothetical protein